MRFFERIRRNEIEAALILLTSYLAAPRRVRPAVELARSIVLRAAGSRITFTINRSLR